MVGIRDRTRLFLCLVLHKGGDMHLGKKASAARLVVLSSPSMQQPHALRIHILSNGFARTDVPACRDDPIEHTISPNETSERPITR